MSPYSYDDDFHREEEWRRQEERRKQEELRWEEQRKQEELRMEEEQHKQEGLWREEKKHADDDYYRSLEHERYDKTDQGSAGTGNSYFAREPKKSTQTANDGNLFFLLIAVVVGLLLYLIYTGSLHF